MVRCTKLGKAKKEYAVGNKDFTNLSKARVYARKKNISTIQSFTVKRWKPIKCATIPKGAKVGGRNAKYLKG